MSFPLLYRTKRLDSSSFSSCSVGSIVSTQKYRIFTLYIPHKPVVYIISNSFYPSKCHDTNDHVSHSTPCMATSKSLPRPNKQVSEKPESKPISFSKFQTITFERNQSTSILIHQIESQRLFLKRSWPRCTLLPNPTFQSSTQRLLQNM